MARDYAKKKKPAPRNKRSASRKQEKKPANPLRWYGAGVLTGVLLSFLLYLGTLPPSQPAPEPVAETDGESQEVPKPRFDFYTMLPEQTMDVEIDPNDVVEPRGSSAAQTEQTYYLLQAGSFKTMEDADRRRAELLLLGLEPRVEESSGDNGRWFRVFLGPFESRSAMAKARSLTAGQEIDTLLLRRNKTP